MSKNQIVTPDYQGYHNKNFDETVKRIQKGKVFKDASTFCIVPAYKAIPPKIVQSWRHLMTPMNQQFYMHFVEGMEVGQAYSSAIQEVINHPVFGKWKYILTLEHDNAPPQDGLLKLIESIDDYDGVGGLYFTKGYGGQPMCYGQIGSADFIPFIPQPDTVTPCRGIAMGFSLYRMDMFRDTRLPRPLFETKQVYTPGVGAQAYTQDLKFCEEAAKLGYKFAVDSRVKVGHYDYENDMWW